MLKFAQMTVHIGEKIKQRAKELRIGSTELGKLINTSKQNIYGIYKRKSTYSEILRKLSKALDYDFFQYYNIETTSIVNEPPSHYGKKNKHTISLEEYQKLKKELEDLKEKYALLKKINILLEKQKKK